MTDTQHSLQLYSSAILASRAVSASVAISLEQRLIRRTPPLPTHVIVVEPGRRQGDNSSVLNLDCSGVSSARVEEPAAVRPGMETCNACHTVGSITAAQTLDLPGQLVQATKHDVRVEAPSTAALLQGVVQIDDWHQALDLDLNESEIEQACLEADGASMAYQEPAHVAMVPLDRAAFIHRNRNLKDKLVLVTANLARVFKPPVKVIGLKIIRTPSGSVTTALSTCRWSHRACMSRNGRSRWT